MSQFIIGLERAIALAKAPVKDGIAMKVPKEWIEPLSPEEKDGFLKLCAHCFELGRAQVVSDVAEEIRKTRSG